jgi:hypothetical protein
MVRSDLLILEEAEARPRAGFAAGKRREPPAVSRKTDASGKEKAEQRSDR